MKRLLNADTGCLPVHFPLVCISTPGGGVPTVARTWSAGGPIRHFTGWLPCRHPMALLGRSPRIRT